MLGAIIGDIVGSRFEFNNHRSTDFDLFADGCFATDDSIMSLAVAKAIMEAAKVRTANSQEYDESFYSLLSDLSVKYMQEIGRKYPNCGFGGMFHRWVFSDNPEPYNSFGNGAAMRVSPAGFAATNEQEAERLAETVTAVTHNHEEGIKGAKAAAVAIVMARQGALKSEIRERIVAEYYQLDFRIEDIRDSYQFNETCQGTVPQAIECFLESTSFEDAIRDAISIGGDSDTIAAITGAIAEAYYGVPDAIKEKALAYLDEELRAIYDAWEQFAPNDGGQFRVLIKYIDKINAAVSFGEWIIDTENDGTMEHPLRLPFVNYSDLVIAFDEDLYQFLKAHPEYDLGDYIEILKQNGIEWGSHAMSSANLENLDELGVLALILGASRAERFCDGAFLGFFENGSVTRWLKRLKDIDRQHQEREVSGIESDSDGHTGELIYCSVSLEEAGKTYYYISEDESIEVGDEVVVPVGAKNNEIFGVVQKIERFSPKNTPFPLGKTKVIIRKTDKLDEQQFIDENLYSYDSNIFSLTPAIQKRVSDVAGSMQCLSRQNQLNQIANGLREISEACNFNLGRIIQEQRDDRLAKLLSSRSSFIQALAMSDEPLRRQRLIQAVGDANSARAEFAYQIKSNIALLGGKKPPKSKDMEKMIYDINTAIIAMNNAVQISLYSYQVLGEHNAQLAVVKEHETFIKQVLQKKIERGGKNHEAWKLICSSGNRGTAPQDLGLLLSKLLDSCAAFTR